MSEKAKWTFAVNTVCVRSLHFMWYEFFHGKDARMSQVSIRQPASAQAPVEIIIMI